MKESELITIVEENQKKIDELNDEISDIKVNTKYLIDEYISESAKYKEGEIVNIITEKYKVPRKYFIKKVWGYVEQPNEKTKRVRIRYDLLTANGHTANRGWSLDETEIRLAK